MENQSKLQFYPISFFAIIMGLAGFTITIQRAESIAGIAHLAGTVLLFLTTLLFLVFALAYLTKIARFPKAAFADVNNPVSINFFPTASIGLLLLSIGYHDVNGTAALGLWLAGTIMHFIATIVILSMWIRQSKFELQHFNPSWFIPIVGNMIVPIAGLSFAPKSLLWFFFSVGIVFWIPLFSMFLYRIFFHHPLPEKLVPTMFILIAPPAVGFLSYVKLSGGIDAFATVLYNFALFLLILLAAQAGMFLRIRFYLSWWAYSFPIAAVAIASAMFFLETDINVYRIIFLALLAALALLIATLTLMTIRAVVRGEICRSE